MCGPFPPPFPETGTRADGLTTLTYVAVSEEYIETGGVAIAEGGVACCCIVTVMLFITVGAVLLYKWGGCTIWGGVVFRTANKQIQTFFS